MRWSELTTGRTFGVTLETGEDFLPSLLAFCTEQEVRYAYLPMFIAGMREAELVGTCEKLANPEAPVWDSVHLETIEAIGCGTIATDPDTNEITAHVHVSVGLKTHSATAYTSHLLSAKVHFLAEMYLVEIAEPSMLRIRDKAQYDAPLLYFG